MTLRLSVSCGYYDRTIPLLAGAVKADGIDLDLPPIKPGTGMGSPDADVYEIPLPVIILQQSRVRTHVGIAAFTKRTFFQQLVITRRESPITSLEQLRGKRVAQLNWYQHSMGVWLRGHLRETYGIEPSEIEWLTQRPSLYGRDDATGAHITLMPADRTPVQLLLDGEVDAVVHEAAHEYVTAHPGLRRVLANPREEESAYFRETGCFPPNHGLLIKREIVEQHPWVAGSLVRAFEESKQISLTTMERNNGVVSTPWLDTLMEEQAAVFGPDPYPNGFAKTRHQIERVSRYLHEQGLLDRPMTPEELFADDSISG